MAPGASALHGGQGASLLKDRRLLLILISIGVAAFVVTAVVGFSGAYFTSTSQSPGNEYAAAGVGLQLSQGGQVVDGVGMRPGDTRAGDQTVTNTDHRAVLVLGVLNLDTGSPQQYVLESSNRATKVHQLLPATLIASSTVNPADTDIDRAFERLPGLRKGGTQAISTAAKARSVPSERRCKRSEISRARSFRFRPTTLMFPIRGNETKPSGLTVYSPARSGHSCTLIFTLSDMPSLKSPARTVAGATATTIARLRAATILRDFLLVMAVLRVPRSQIADHRNGPTYQLSGAGRFGLK